MSDCGASENRIASAAASSLERPGVDRGGWTLSFGGPEQQVLEARTREASLRPCARSNTGNCHLSLAFGPGSAGARYSNQNLAGDHMRIFTAAKSTRNSAVQRNALDQKPIVLYLATSDQAGASTPLIAQFIGISRIAIPELCLCSIVPAPAIA